MKFSKLNPSQKFISAELASGRYMKVKDNTGGIEDKYCYVYLAEGTLHAWSYDFDVQRIDDNGVIIPETYTPLTAENGKRYSACGHSDFIFYNKWTDFSNQSSFTECRSKQGTKFAGIGVEKDGIFLITSNGYEMTPLD